MIIEEDKRTDDVGPPDWHAVLFWIAVAVLDVVIIGVIVKTVT